MTVSLTVMTVNITVRSLHNGAPMGGHTPIMADMNVMTLAAAIQACETQLAKVNHGVLRQAMRAIIPSNSDWRPANRDAGMPVMLKAIVDYLDDPNTSDGDKIRQLETYLNVQIKRAPDRAKSLAGGVVVPLSTFEPVHTEPPRRKPTAHKPSHKSRRVPTPVARHKRDDLSVDSSEVSSEEPAEPKKKKRSPVSDSDDAPPKRRKVDRRKVDDRRNELPDLPEDIMGPEDDYPDSGPVTDPLPPVYEDEDDTSVVTFTDSPLTANSQLTTESPDEVPVASHAKKKLPPVKKVYPQVSFQSDRTPLETVVKDYASYWNFVKLFHPQVFTNTWTAIMQEDGLNVTIKPCLACTGFSVWATDTFKCVVELVSFYFPPLDVALR